jgi:flagellar hook-length control protein FliK
MAGTIAPHDTVQTAPALAVNLQVSSGHPNGDAPSSLDSLGITIATKSQDGIKHFDISMTPPELGRVEVRLSMGDDGKTQASLVVDKPQTLALLQQDAPNLSRALNDAGLSMSNNGLNFSLRNGQERQNDSGQAPRGRGRALSINAVAATAQVSNSIASLAPDGVRLDIRV